MSKKLIVLVPLVLALGGARNNGCGGGHVGGAMPDVATLALESPDDADASSSSAAQAVCASDSAAYDAIKERIATYNATIQERIALVKALEKAAARELAKPGQTEYTRTVSRAGFTLVLHALENEDGSVGYDATLTNPQGVDVRLLTGTAEGDLSSGSWDLFRATGDVAVHVDWVKGDGDDLTVDRTATGAFGTRTSHYERNATSTKVDFAGPNHDAHAEWDRQTKDGSITVDGVQKCWDASDDLSDFCSVPCA